jgi:hypothetical protein
MKRLERGLLIHPTHFLSLRPFLKGEGETVYASKQRLREQASRLIWPLTGH